jgi:hypothetical protein
MARDLEKLQETHSIRAQVLTSQRISKMALDPTPPPLTQLHCMRTLAHVREYARTMCALAPNTLVAPLVKTIATLHYLHPLPGLTSPFLLTIFIQRQIFVLDRESLIFALTHSPHLSSSDPLVMVYELLWD